MIKLRIERYKDFADSTLGSFTLLKDGEILQTGYTLEPAGPDTETANKDRRIPWGIYNAIWDASSQTGVDVVGALPLLYNDKVSKSRLIRIHVGNYGKDTTGCILLGDGSSGNGSILKSKDAIIKFCKLVYPENFEVEIINSIPEQTNVDV